MSVIDEYLANLDSSQRNDLERIRVAVKKIAPGAEEVMTYGVPGFKYKGHFLVGYAVNKKFLSLYPASTAIEVFKDKLTGFGLSKGVIRFTAENPIPGDLLEQIIAFRYHQVSGK